MNKRNVSIDIFRAIAIILITGYHIQQFVGNPRKLVFIWDFYAPIIKGNAGIALFVFISGYVTHLSSYKKPWTDFIKERFWRIAVPYYIALFTWNILLVFFTDIRGATHNTVDNLTHLLFIHNLHPTTFYSISGVFWYVGLQMQLYLAYALLKPLINRHSLSIGTISFVICILLNTLPHFLVAQSEWQIIIFSSVFSYAFLFFLGTIFMEYNGKIIPVLQKPGVFYCLLMLTLCGLFYKNPLIWCGRLENMILGLLLGLIMLGMPKINENNIFVKAMCTIGVASYSIYLYNFIFYTFLARQLGFKGLLTYSTITIFFGVGAYYLIEKPLLKEKQLS